MKFGILTSESAHTFELQAMTDIGKELKKALAEGGFTQAQVAKRLGKGKNTIHRWTNSPNLGLKEVREVHAAIPELYLRNVYEALESSLGHEIPDNPYRNPNRPEKPSNTEAKSGIQLMIDAKEFAGYKIPHDILERVVNILEDAQDDGYGNGPAPKPDKY